MTTVVIVLQLMFGAAAVAGGAWLALRGPVLLAGRLRGAPLKSLLWPGLALLVLGGGSLLAAAGVLLSGDIHTGRLVSVEAGVVLAGWGTMMLSALGRRHWLQLLPVVLGLVLIVLSFRIPVPG